MPWRDAVTFKICLSSEAEKQKLREKTLRVKFYSNFTQFSLHTVERYGMGFPTEMVVGKLASGRKRGYQSQSKWETGSVSKNSVYIQYKEGKKFLQQNF